MLIVSFLNRRLKSGYVTLYNKKMYKILLFFFVVTKTRRNFNNFTVQKTLSIKELHFNQVSKKK